MAHLKKWNHRMSYNINRIALVDSGFWYALLDERDSYYRDAQSRADMLLNLRYMIPWPILYETLCTRFTRRPLVIRKFEGLLKRPNAVVLDDKKYRNDALERTLSDAGKGGRAFSLVDNVLRGIMGDGSVRVNCLLTFNPGDFSDLCVRRQIELL
jgi:predicted nucleic acid-binding protein